MAGSASHLPSMRSVERVPAGMNGISSRLPLTATDGYVCAAIEKQILFYDFSEVGRVLLRTFPS